MTGDYPDPIFIDDCSEVTLEVVGVNYSYAECAGDYSVTTVWEATDGCGNKREHKQMDVAKWVVETAQKIVVNRRPHLALQGDLP